MSGAGVKKFVDVDRLGLGNGKMVFKADNGAVVNVKGTLSQLREAIDTLDKRAVEDDKHRLLKWLGIKK